ncbi:site-specific DNA-methyltransferase [Gemmatimonas sp.]|uniref:site-specific DNA-methyltransferase n=1 Tax=Gemmatimonas sp. TaxID=1962908 RepID=UPI003F7109E3
MQALTFHDSETKSSDLVAANLAALRSLFPELVTEGANGTRIDLDVLKQLVGDQTLTDAEEKYGLNWHGKRRARQLALATSTGTLRPSHAESVDWETTKNLLIEGDNLEVLKLLQKSYAGKVKLIYIDPPYNTGKDFVYPDNFQDSIKSYLELTGQTGEGGRKLSSNTEASGRFHTDWLNMMYPRLKLARNLLREDGVIFLSIDDGELDNLRMLLNEVFGEENFVVQIIWRKRSTPPNDKVIGANHDYIVCFAKDLPSVGLNLRERSEEQVARYRNPDNHPKGPWAPGDLMANVKGGRFVKSLYFPIVNPNTGEEHYPGTNGNYRFSAETIANLIAADEISFGEDGRGKPKLKRFLCDVKEGVTYPSIWDFVPLNTNGSNEMAELFDNSTIFESPKPVGLIQEIVKLGATSDSLVLDFFGGSGSTGHAVMLQNSVDSGSRRYVVVQLPEMTPGDSEARKAGYKSIADLTKARLKRAGQKIREKNPLFAGDLGFRVFKLASSNIQAWEPNRDNIAETLEASIVHLKTDRTEQDILYELLLKLGLDLCVAIEAKMVTGSGSSAHEVHSIGGGSLLACLSRSIPQADVETLAAFIVAWHDTLKPAGESTVIFRDSAFSDDVAKSNLSAILNQHGLTNVRSL